MDAPIALQTIGTRRRAEPDQGRSEYMYERPVSRSASPRSFDPAPHTAHPSPPGPRIRFARAEPSSPVRNRPPGAVAGSACPGAAPNARQGNDVVTLNYPYNSIMMKDIQAPTVQEWVRRASRASYPPALSNPVPLRQPPVSGDRHLLPFTIGRFAWISHCRPRVAEG
jgi:hypothetical protein